MLGLSEPMSDSVLFYGTTDLHRSVYTWQSAVRVPAWVVTRRESDTYTARTEAAQTLPLVFTMTASYSATSETNKSNKHCVLVGKESVRIEERPVPECGPGQVLIYIMATGM